MKYDLLISGGRVIDPLAKFDGSADVGLKNGLVAEMEPDLDKAEAGRVIDASGLIVVPGLIDYHAHAFIGADNLGLALDEACLSTGVTTLVDGGSVGAATFKGFKELVIDRSRVRVLSFLHISSIGLADIAVGESTYLDLHDPERAAETARAYPDLIKGIKVRQQKEIVGDNGLEPLRRAKQAAKLAGGLPVMVHVTNPPVPLREIMDLLDPGDTVTHFLHGRGYGLLNDQGRTAEEAWAARERGLIFDTARGMSNFNFEVARVALADGFLPDVISTDMTAAGRAGIVKSLPHCLATFLTLGLSLSQVIEMSTLAPARLLGWDDRIGSLQLGRIGDVALFELVEAETEFIDAEGGRLVGARRLEPRYTISDGQVAWSDLGS